MQYRCRLLLTSATTVALAFASFAPHATADRSPQQQLHSDHAMQTHDQTLTHLHNQLNEVLGLKRSTLLSMPLENMDPTKPFSITVPIAEQEYTFQLWPHSVRADGFRVHVQLDDGSLKEVDPGPDRTIRGHIEQHPGALVVGSVLPYGLHLAVLFPNGDSYWIEPAQPHLDVDASWHVLYDPEDADCGEGQCGVPEAWQQVNNLVDPGSDNQMAISGEEQCHVAEIAIDADFHYYQQLGSNVENVVNNVTSIIETLNVQYETQVGIRHEITEIVVRTSESQNPYSTNNAGTLLNQFRNAWTSFPELGIPRDLAHLFTGRNLNGGTLGIAWTGTVCSSPFGQHYALSQRLFNFGCMTDLVAHEIGHNWGSPHCSCPSNTMNPSLTCANNFSTTSINSITIHKNSVTCLDTCIPPPPPNDTCNNSLVVGTGSTSVSTISATTSGHTESQLCPGDGNVQSDVWLVSQVQCTGEWTVTITDADFPAKFAVYEGQQCPTAPDQAIACTSSAGQPQVTLDVEQFDIFRIRVGGENGAQGEATLEIHCEPAPEPICPADLSGPSGEPDGTVDIFDLLLVIGEWGSCDDPDACPADITGPAGEPDGTVDIFDLLKVIAEWGQCDDA